MIDAHLHVVPPNLPGVGSLHALLEGPRPALALALRHEMAAAGVEKALAMGCCNAAPDDPLGVAETLEIARAVPGLFAIGIADPTRTDPEHLRRIESQLGSRQVRAMKGYLGYLHFGPEYPGYHPYYELAEKYSLPFFFHTGDTYSTRAKLRFAQPLLVDDVAVDFPKVKFIIAHLGNPWMLEGAEVIYKNPNVWADLSGLAVGDASSLGSEEGLERWHEVAVRIRQAFQYAEKPDRFLYGSDWPLAPLATYRALIRMALPEKHHSRIFEENARALFGF